MSHTLLEYLPNEIIYNIAINYLELLDIFNLTMTCKRFNNLIYKDDKFWRSICIRDLKCDEKECEKDWKNLYKSYLDTWYIGCLNNYCKYVPEQIDKIKVKKIAAGLTHSVFLDYNNNIWICGENKHGNIGLGHANPMLTPTLLKDYKAIDIAAAKNNTIFIDLQNNAWVLGFNDYGQLGLRHTYCTNSPTKISNIKAKKIYCGEYHSLIIDVDYNVWITGSNKDGQLGLGDYEDRRILTQIKNIKAKNASIGYNHTIIIDLYNNVWVFGNNNEGKLGLGDNLDRNIPTLLPYLKAKRVSAGYSSSYLIDMEDNLWAFGDNSQGQLGTYDIYTRKNPTKINCFEHIQDSSQINSKCCLKVREVSAGLRHAVLIDLKNNVWICGTGLGRFSYLPRRGLHKQYLDKIRNFKAWSISSGSHHTLIIGSNKNIIAK